MATLATQIINDAKAIFIETDDFAEAITYTPAGQAGVSRNAQVNRMGTSEDEAEDGTLTVHHAQVGLCRNANLGIANPAINDLVTFDSIVWRVDEITYQDSAWTHLRVVRVTRANNAEAEYRVERV